MGWFGCFAGLPWWWRKTMSLQGLALEGASFWFGRETQIPNLRETVWRVAKQFLPPVWPSDSSDFAQAVFLSMGFCHLPLATSRLLRWEAKQFPGRVGLPIGLNMFKPLVIHKL